MWFLWECQGHGLKTVTNQLIITQQKLEEFLTGPFPRRQYKLICFSVVHAPISNKTVKIQERFLFVLGCLTPKCGSSSESWRVLRVQKTCTQDLEVASATTSSPAVQSTSWLDDVNDDDDMDLEQLRKALFEAGTLASSRKKSVSRSRTDTASSSSPKPRVSEVDIDMPVVPCFYIYYVHEEPSSEGLSSICSNYSSLSIKENGSDNEDEVWEKESYEYDRALTADRTYLKFKKRLEAHPEQCFRYSYGGKPLLAAVDKIDPGRCKLCGEPRNFEMQLMPPLLYFLQEAPDDKKRLVENWDWMTLMIYTCSKSCSEIIDRGKPKSSEWIVTEEAVVAQCEKSMPVRNYDW
ncbi:probable 20S rRNA accumulation protein 4 isoform X2 [Neltuma alba]|uniref:probable 20S rRNA accumulation protein 4 isoform X2 n=1 Tax=Neltuma alba TaxID=207710 RepID=UPI0010A3647F|nr:probable 20S rRNA accumulation protein 4 isoform X2 [Prosopis alba]